LLKAVLTSIAGFAFAVAIAAIGPFTSQPAAALNGASPSLVTDMRTDVPRAFETVAHKSCGSMGTAGRCASGVRSCLASGKPKGVCDAWGKGCTECQTTFISCGKRLGHIKRPFGTCEGCKSQYDACVARLPR